MSSDRFPSVSKLITESSDGFNAMALVYSTNNVSQSIVVFVHGLLGEPNNHFIRSALPYFSDKGYSTCCINFYPEAEKSRSTQNSTISTQAADIDAVVQELLGEYKKIHLVAHSLGCAAAISSKQENFASMVFWDPAIDVMKGYSQEGDSKYSYIEECDCVVLHRGFDVLVSPQMVFEMGSVDSSMISKIQRPTRIICAGSSEFRQSWYEYRDQIPSHCDLKTVAGASHCFDEFGAPETLHRHTMEWIHAKENK